MERCRGRGRTRMDNNLRCGGSRGGNPARRRRRRQPRHRGTFGEHHHHAERETAGSKVIRISQEPKVLPPSFSLSYREGEVPEEGFTLNYRGYIEGNYTTTNHKIDIEAVNIDWQATVAYDSAVTNWITLHPYKSDSKNHIEFSAAQNEEAAPRACRIIVSTDAEGIGPFEIAVTQEGRPNFLSTLTEDVDSAS